MTIEKPSEMDLAALDSTLQQLQKKKEVLISLDNKIIDGIKDEDELENEIVETENMQSDIGEKIFQVGKFLELQRLSNISIPHQPKNIMKQRHRSDQKAKQL
jgi:hypothetical protein